MRYTLFFALPLVAALAFTTNVSSAQDKDAKPGMDEMMKQWTEFSTPAEPHKRLADMVGLWSTETKVWMGGPGTEPNVTTGKSTMSMILGGRFLRQDMTGETMGVPMHGLGITGYDNFKRKYVGFWIDDMGTAIYTMEGEMDPDGKTCTYWGSMDEPTTGEKGKRVKYTLTMVDKDRHIFRIYDVGTYGENDPTMEIVYMRAE